MIRWWQSRTSTLGKLHYWQNAIWMGVGRDLWQADPLAGYLQGVTWLDPVPGWWQYQEREGRMFEKRCKREIATDWIWGGGVVRDSEELRMIPRLWTWVSPGRMLILSIVGGFWKLENLRRKIEFSYGLVEFKMSTGNLVWNSSKAFWDRRSAWRLEQARHIWESSAWWLY